MADKNIEKLEDILSEYFNLRLLQAENRQCYASLQTILANIGITASDITVKSLEIGGIITLLEVDYKLTSSLNKITIAMYEWRKCKDLQAANEGSEYNTCIRECYFTIGISKAIEEYLKEMKHAKYDKSSLKNKIDELIKSIEHLSSINVLNFLFKKFEEKLEEEFDKIANKKYSDLTEAFYTHINIYQRASDYIKDFVLGLLKNPIENIKEFNESIKNTETKDYKDDKKRSNMYDTYIN